MHPRRFVLLIALAALFLMGCGPSWVVRTQAVPNPFLGQRQFGLLPMVFQGLTVGDKGEAEWLSEKDAEQRASWAADKVAMDAEFAGGLVGRAGEAGIVVVPATGPQAAPFFVRPYVQFVEPGFFALVVNKPSEVRMRVQITAQDGRVLDEFDIQSKTGAGISTAASGSRVRRDAKSLGEQAGRYLESRVSTDIY